MALTPPPTSNIPAWAAAGNNPYNIPALGQFYNVMKQDPGFAMNEFSNLPGMRNLVMSAVNGGPLNGASNPALTDYRNLDMYYGGGNGYRPQGFLEGLGANQMNPTANLAAGWTVAPGGMKNMNAINQWAQKVNAAAYGNNQAQYNQLMSATPQGVKLINFNGSQLGIPGASTANINPGVTNQTPAGTNATGNPTGNPVNPYGAGYTGFGNINLSTAPGGTTNNPTGVTSNGTTPTGSVNNPTGVGPQGQAPGTAGSWVAGPPTVSNVNTNASALPTNNPTGAGPQGQAPGTAGSFVAGPPQRTSMPVTMRNLNGNTGNPVNAASFYQSKY